MNNTNVVSTFPLFVFFPYHFFGASDLFTFLKQNSLCRFCTHFLGVIYISSYGACLKFHLCSWTHWNNNDNELNFWVSSQCATTLCVCDRNSSVPFNTCYFFFFHWLLHAAREKENIRHDFFFIRYINRTVDCFESKWIGIQTFSFSSSAFPNECICGRSCAQFKSFVCYFPSLQYGINMCFRVLFYYMAKIKLRLMLFMHEIM